MGQLPHLISKVGQNSPTQFQKWARKFWRKNLTTDNKDVIYFTQKWLSKKQTYGILRILTLLDESHSSLRSLMTINKGHQQCSLSLVVNFGTTDLPSSNRCSFLAFNILTMFIALTEVIQYIFTFGCGFIFRSEVRHFETKTCFPTRPNMTHNNQRDWLPLKVRHAFRLADICGKAVRSSR